MGSMQGVAATGQLQGAWAGGSSALVLGRQSHHLHGGVHGQCSAKNVLPQAPGKPGWHSMSSSSCMFATAALNSSAQALTNSWAKGRPTSAHYGHVTVRCRHSQQQPHGRCHWAQKCGRHVPCSAALIDSATDACDAPPAAARHMPGRSPRLQPLGEPELQRQMQRQVVQVRTLHLVPNYARPWETGHEVQSSCTAFVLDPVRRLLITTAGAVEAARKVVVCRVDDETEYTAHVVALCMDTDTALLTVGGVRDSAALQPLKTSRASDHTSHHIHRTAQPLDQGQAVRNTGRPLDEDQAVGNTRQSFDQGQTVCNTGQSSRHDGGQATQELQGSIAGDGQEEDDEEQEVDFGVEEEEGGEEEDGGEEEEEEVVQRQAGNSRLRRRAGSRRAQLADEFWQGLQATGWGVLPPLQAPVRVAGFPIGGDTLCITSGVLSRCEVLEYSHANRNLLALQVDAPLNNGVWGGPAYDSYGRVMGMAFQKFTTQTWMERYDEDGLDALQDFEEEEDEEGQGSGQAGDGDASEGPPGGGSDGEEDAENVGYCVPALLLQHTVHAWEQAHAALAHGSSGSSGSISSSDTQHESSSSGSSSSSDAQHWSSSSSSSGSSSSGAQHGMHDSSSSGWSVYTGSSACFKDCILLPGPPVLGIRWQSIQAPALEAHLGLRPTESGIRVSAVDPSGSAAGVIQPNDVLTSMGGQPIAGDGTILLRSCQRVLYGHAASSRLVGETLPAAVIRDGRHLQLQLKLVAYPPLVPSALGPSRPLYLIIGGAVLLQLTLPFMYTQDTPKSKGRRLKDWTWGHLGVVEALEWALKTQAGDEQVIILSELLSGSVAADGYSAELGRGIRRLVSVNGVRVINMLHLAQLIVQPGSLQTKNAINSNHSGEGGAGHLRAQDLQALGHRQHPGFVTLGFADGSMMLLDAETLARDTQAALAHQGIQHAMSARLRAQLGAAGRPCVWPRTDSSKTDAAGLQKRQQRRRLAFRR